MEVMFTYFLHSPWFKHRNTNPRHNYYYDKFYFFINHLKKVLNKENIVGFDKIYF